MTRNEMDVVVKVSGVEGFVRGRVSPMNPSQTTTVGSILEEAKKRGQLSIETSDGLVAINTDHIILINEDGYGEEEAP